jgi:hypothetical protein
MRVKVLLATVVWVLIQQTLCQVPPEQITALQEFYAASNPATWDSSGSWISAADPCFPVANSWVGIGCNGAGKIDRINLASSGVQGSIPNSWRNLVDVTEM